MYVISRRRYYIRAAILIYKAQKKFYRLRLEEGCSLHLKTTMSAERIVLCTTIAAKIVHSITLGLQL